MSNPLNDLQGPTEWPAVVLVKDVMAKGEIPLTLSANAAERAAIAKRLNLLALDRFEARLIAARWGAGGVRLEGVMTAEVAQACVVTLQPVPERLEEPVLARFAKDAPTPTTEADLNDYDLLDPDAPDPPDPLPADGRVHIGELLIQLLSVALDPYPRAEGATLEGTGEGEAGAKSGADHPFAALAALKGRR